MHRLTASSPSGDPRAYPGERLRVEFDEIAAIGPGRSRRYRYVVRRVARSHGDSAAFVAGGSPATRRPGSA